MTETSTDASHLLDSCGVKHSNVVCAPGWRNGKDVMRNEERVYILCKDSVSTQGTEESTMGDVRLFVIMYQMPWSYTIL